MSNCTIITLEGGTALMNPPPQRHMHTHIKTHLPPHRHTPMQSHSTNTCHKWFHVPPSNGQCRLTLCPHMSCLCEHDVSHPCTHTFCILRWAPTISPTYAELIYAYTSFGLGVPITHTHPHLR
ncbi:hypothetical protein O181_091732 [Austropuccinia psidii MF-1]|uniref:Uncharacterized protein n=1 Tax=Austropuccinia psidii MF-1 TaxID=1389203 RepID=A0A9Q3IY49_9BASI|nr:hypothetical protein [Austropuccinia psidii MF-1]